MVDFIHIGYPKTGTTYIQQHLFNHPGLHVLGYGKSLSFKDLILKINFENDLIYDHKKIDHLIQEELSAIKAGPGKGKVVGISRESLSGNYLGLTSKVIADRLFDLFKSAKIIITIRNQLDMIDSIHSQFVKKGYSHRIRQFSRDNLIMISKIYEFLQYHHLVDYYSNKFGPDNVLVLMHEDLMSEKKVFTQKLFGFIGCDPESSMACQPSTNIMYNSKLYPLTRNVMTFLNYLGCNPVKTRKILERYGIKEKKRANSWMMELIRAETINSFRQSNRILADKYSLPLETKGYLF